MKHVVAALIVRKGRLLICQRTKLQPMPLKWEFPGGKIEAGELPAEALRRELQEELGIDAIIGDEVACLEHQYVGGSVLELRFFLVYEWQGEIDNRIFQTLRWARRGDLPHYDFLEADRRLVEDIAAGKLIG
jgi:8-oxo-dGTP diphosphatase